MQTSEPKKQRMKKITFFQSTIFRIVAVIIALVLPINIMTLVLSNMVLEKNKEQMSREILNTLELNARNFEDVLSRARKKLIYLSFGEKEFVSLSKGSDNLSQNEKGRLLREVTQTLKTTQSEYPWIDLLYYHFPESGYIVCAGYPGVSYTACKDKIKQKAELENQKEMGWEVCKIDDTNTLFGYYSWNGSKFGVIVNLERLLKKLNFVTEEEGRSIFFIDQERTLYTIEGSRFFEEQGLTMADLENSGHYQVYSIEIAQTGLILMEVVEISRQSERLPATIMVLQVLSIITTILVIPLILLYVRRWVIRPLKRLVGAMDEIEQGQLDYRIKSAGDGREFEQINRSFNTMMDQVSSLKIDVYEKELERKNIKMRYLSQQIQPHFILNAMNIIYSYEPEEYPLIQKLVLCISKYFRYIVKVNAEFVLLSQEMEHIQNYFEIQRARFPELFYATVEYEESLGNVLIPPLIIQNFAENAIKHSLRIGNRISISVTAGCSDVEDITRLHILLKDTGEGISDDVLEKIEIFRKTGKMQEGLGVGIQNAIERLEFLYPQKTSVKFWRTNNPSGTSVEIILPVYYGNEQKGAGYYADITG